MVLGRIPAAKCTCLLQKILLGGPEEISIKDRLRSQTAEIKVILKPLAENVVKSPLPFAVVQSITHYITSSTATITVKQGLMNPTQAGLKLIKDDFEFLVLGFPPPVCCIPGLCYHVWFSSFNFLNHFFFFLIVLGLLRLHFTYVRVFRTQMVEQQVFMEHTPLTPIDHYTPISLSYSILVFPELKSPK